VCLYVCDQETPKREAKGTSWTVSACEWMNFTQAQLIMIGSKTIVGVTSEPAHTGDNSLTVWMGNGRRVSFMG
jgi:hypothetical protein